MVKSQQINIIQAYHLGRSLLYYLEMGRQKSPKGVKAKKYKLNKTVPEKLSYIRKANYFQIINFYATCFRIKFDELQSTSVLVVLHSIPKILALFHSVESFYPI